MSNLSGFNSDVEIGKLKFSVRTEFIPTENSGRIVTFVSSSSGASFSFSTFPQGIPDNDEIGGCHEKIISKLPFLLSAKPSSGTGNTADYASLYVGKQFANYPANSRNMLENVRKILVFKDGGWE